MMSMTGMVDAPIEAALAAATQRLTALLPRLQAELSNGLLPHVTEKGRWQWEPFAQSGRWDGDRWSHGYWTGGFVAGWYWQAAQVAADPSPFRAMAQACSEALAVRADDQITHDVGFLFWPSAVLGAMATGSEHLQEIGRRAARSLLSRRHPSGLLQAWGDLSDPRARGSSTIDTMMNLPLLWWADRNGVPGAADAAIAHARLSAGLYVRSDGTTYHTARIDEQGGPLERGTYQGYAPGSCWSRGQAWAVHGFADAYRMTGDPQFGAVARQVADAFVARLPEDGIAPWDFDDPNRNAAPRDASANAIVAAGLLKLGRAEQARPGGMEAAERWLRIGTRLTHALIEHAANRGTADGLLLASTYSVPHHSGVSGAVTWGDYFYLECLLLLQHPTLILDPTRR